MRPSMASRVAQQIRADYIASGRLQPGDALPSMRALEAEYGASVATIAHAVGQLLAQGLVRKGRGGRAFVAERDVARAGAAGQAIGLAFPEAARPDLHMRILAGVERAARRLGWQVMVAHGQDYGYEREEETVARLVASGCRAIVLNPSQRTESELQHDYLNRMFTDIPIVLVDMGLPQHRRSQVVFDNFGAGYDMTRLLLSEGHTRIAFMAAFGGENRMFWPSNHDRYLGYVAALTEAGVAAEPSWLWHIRTRENAAPLIEQCAGLLHRWAADRDRCTAVIALEDQLAICLAIEAREEGIAVPGDLVVTGFDNTADQCPVRPYFYTTVPDFTLAGEKAVELATRELRGEIGVPLCYMLPVPVVRRTPTSLEPVSVPRGSAPMATLAIP